MTIITTIIEQHAENAAFNWLLRDGAVGEPHYNLADLAHLDDRVEANIDGLRIAGDAGWEICREAMAYEEPGEIFAAGVLAFESQAPKRMDALLGAVSENDELLRALCSALGWIDFRRVAEPVSKLLEAGSPIFRRIGLSACAIHRQDMGTTLAACVSDGDPQVRARALKAVGELGRTDLLPALLDGMANESDEACRFYAAWSAALLGHRAGVDGLKNLAETQSVHGRRACDMAVRRMDHGPAGNWLNTLGRQDSLTRWAIKGCGALGDPQAVSWLIEKMQTSALARSAGEAFSMITGVDLAYDDLDTDAPEGFEAGPTDDPDDEDVAMDPDEDLPWPAPELIAAWWRDHRSRFQSGQRYLAGRPITMEDCRQVLRNGFQRQRMAAAVEMALLQPGRSLFEVRAPGFQQQRQLATT